MEKPERPARFYVPDLAEGAQKRCQEPFAGYSEFTNEHARLSSP